MAAKALAGIRVVELTTYVAAPICGRMLSDLGAEVIKVESPSGDPWRRNGRNIAITPRGEINAIFDMGNSGKKNIVLDLKQTAGKEAFLKLIGTADVFLTNTRLDSLKKLGLDYETLHAILPKLIYATVTGYGDDGPIAKQPGFDLVAFWSLSGFLADMSYEENPYPVIAPTSVGDLTVGSMLTNTILASLLLREKTGQGDYVTISLYNTALWVMSTAIIRAGSCYKAELRESYRKANPMITSYLCADGEWLQLAIIEEARYASAFFEILGIPELNDDPRFSTDKARFAHAVELLETVTPIFASKSCSEWVALFQARDIVCSPVAHFRDIERSEQAWANEYLETFRSSNGAQCVVPCSPIRMASCGTIHTQPAAKMGEDTNAILKQLGYSFEQIYAMVNAGAARQFKN